MQVILKLSNSEAAGSIVQVLVPTIHDYLYALQMCIIRSIMISIFFLIFPHLSAYSEILALGCDNGWVAYSAFGV